MSSVSFARFTTVTASTKRATITGGKKGLPSTQIASLSCSPLDPVGEDIRRRFQLSTPFEMLQTFVEGNLDIKPGDKLVVGSTEYDIRAVADWTWDDTKYMHLVIEELRR